MLIVNGAMYKDVNQQDFSHYFANTVMAWKLSPTKNRAVVIGGCEGGRIKGCFLTPEGEFKDKDFPFQSWWEPLHPIPLQTLMFNIPGGAGVWYHKLQKNLKKSFPWAINAVYFYGNVDVASKTSQNVLKHAFLDLYGIQPRIPTLAYALAHGETTVTQGGFLLDRAQGKLHHHRQVVAQTKGDRLQIPKSKAVLLNLFARHGIPPSQIDLVEEENVKVVPPEGPLPMKLNGQWVEGYHPNFFEGGPWYSVVRFKPGYQEEFRTYKGPYPGPHLLLPGWKIYNYGGLGL